MLPIQTNFLTSLYDYRIRVERDTGARDPLERIDQDNPDREVAATVACLPDWQFIGNAKFPEGLELDVMDPESVEGPFPAAEYFTTVFFTEAHWSDPVALSTEEYTVTDEPLDPVGIVAIKKEDAIVKWGDIGEASLRERCGVLAAQILDRRMHFLNDDVQKVVLERRVANSVAREFGIDDAARPWLEIRSTSGLIPNHSEMDNVLKEYSDTRDAYAKNDLEERIPVETVKLTGVPYEIETDRSDNPRANFMLAVRVLPHLPDAEKVGIYGSKTLEFHGIAVDGAETLNDLAESVGTDSSLELTRYLTGKGELYACVTKVSSQQLDIAERNSVAAVRTQTMLGY